MTGSILLSPVRDDLRARAAYAEGAGIYRVVPASVAQPGTYDEVRRILAWAREKRIAVTPRGAGSAMAGGNVGEGLILDLSCLDHARVAVDPNTRIARTAPGATGAAINSAALPHRLRLAPDPSSLRFATSGGMVSTNASGARSYRTGSVRRWVAGLDILTVDGNLLTLDRGKSAPGIPEVLRFERDVAPKIRAARATIRARFPRTRKNSSGYALDAWLDSDDLIDLFVGSEGTLGLIVGVRWELDSIPDSRGGLRIAVETDAQMMEALDLIRRTGPAAVEVLDRTFLKFVAESLSASTRQLAIRSSAILLVEYEGNPAAVQRTLAAVRARLGTIAYEASAAFGPSALAALWGIRHAASPLLARLGDRRRSLQVIEDGSVPVNRLADYLAVLREIPARHGVEVVVFGHAGDGHLHVNLLPDTTKPGWEKTVATIFDNVSATQIELGGTPSGEHGDGRLRTPLLERVYGGEIVDLFRALKKAFDPNCLLNPGVKVAGGAGREAGEGRGPISQLKVGASAAALPDDIAATLRDIERSGSWDTDRMTLADRPARLPASPPARP
ncbi:MAG TPA: FAD-binding oxidoreductase [Gemmatimonadales bacterium]|nr:FAD-binding oxidoreductase [Gemmatimonadales bacterium]